MIIPIYWVELMFPCLFVIAWSINGSFKSAIFFYGDSYIYTFVNFVQERIAYRVYIEYPMYTTITAMNPSFSVMSQSNKSSWHIGIF